MRTIVDKMGFAEHRNLCGLVAGMLPSLKWRHNGLGLLQAYVHEGPTQELRVHVWHRSLMREGIEESGLLHDHRFNLHSSVLVGSIDQEEYELIPWQGDHSTVYRHRDRGIIDEGHYYTTIDNGWQLHTVVPARKALAKSGTNDGLVEALPERYSVKTKSAIIKAGDRYFFPKFCVHGTHTMTDLVVTLVEKTEQEDAPAKILAPWGKRVVHAFADPFPEEQWLPVLAEAREKLLAGWRG